MKVKEVGKSMNLWLLGLLANKPVWVFWIVYAALTAILFGLFYASINLLVRYWWIPTLTILLVGIIWGTISYAKSMNEEEFIS